MMVECRQCVTLVRHAEGSYLPIDFLVSPFSFTIVGCRLSRAVLEMIITWYTLLLMGISLLRPNQTTITTLLSPFFCYLLFRYSHIETSH